MFDLFTRLARIPRYVSDVLCIVCGFLAHVTCSAFFLPLFQWVLGWALEFGPHAEVICVLVSPASVLISTLSPLVSPVSAIARSLTTLGHTGLAIALTGLISGLTGLISTLTRRTSTLMISVGRPKSSADHSTSTFTQHPPSFSRGSGLGCRDCPRPPSPVTSWLYRHGRHT